MALQYRAAVLHAAQTPMSIETITAAELKPNDVLVRIRAAGLCHTDLEVIEGSLRYPMPIVLGHEAAGVVEEVGAGRARRRGRRSCRAVVEPALRPLLLLRPRRADPVRAISRRKGPKGVAFDGATRATLADGRPVQHLMFLGAFGEYCIVSGSAGDSGAEGDPVRSRLPDRLRRHDRRRRRAQSRRHRAMATP